MSDLRVDLEWYITDLLKAAKMHENWPQQYSLGKREAYEKVARDLTTLLATEPPAAKEQPKSGA